jgi:hypothetical protein
LSFEVAFKQAVSVANDQEADYPNPNQVCGQTNHHEWNAVLGQKGGRGR